MNCWIIVVGLLDLVSFSVQALAVCKLDAINADALSCVTKKSHCVYSPANCDIAGIPVQELVTNKYSYSELSTDVLLDGCEELTELMKVMERLLKCDHFWYSSHRGDSRKFFLPSSVCTMACPAFLQVLIPLVKEAKNPPAPGPSVTIQEVTCLEVHEGANVRMDYELLVKGGAAAASFNFSMNCPGYSKMVKNQRISANTVKRVPFPSVAGTKNPMNCTASAWIDGKAVATKTASCTVGFF